MAVHSSAVAPAKRVVAPLKTTAITAASHRPLATAAPSTAPRQAPSAVKAAGIDETGTRTTHAANAGHHVRTNDNARSHA